MTKGVARPVQPKTEVRRFVEDALHRFAIDNGRALGRQDRIVYTYPSCRIVLQGESNLSHPWAAYYGELGEWTVGLGVGSSRFKTICPVLVKSSAELSTH